MRIQSSKSVVRRLQAFTLVEVVIAVCILGISAAGLMGCFSWAFTMTALTQENQRATQVMLERAEAIRLCKWDDVVNNSGFIPETFEEYYDPDPSAKSKGVIYTGTAIISEFPYATSYATNMRVLTLTVNWTTGGKIKHSRTNVTYLAKDGIQNYVY